MTRFFLALIILALPGAGCTKSGDSVEALKTQYPVVRYHGPKKPFTVSLQRSRPSSWVSLGSIPKAAVGAIVVSEDWAFYQHQGIDTNQIKEAIEKDLKAGGFKRGASTITQQVVKNVFLERDKTVGRKVNEIVLALKLEKAVSKGRILEIYLNIAEWGEGVFGIQRAAQHYFGKSASELTPKEGAFLAMLLPSPKRYSQSFRKKQLTPYASKTIRSILNKMVQARYLTAEDRAFEGARRLSFEAPDAPVESLTPEASVPPVTDAEEAAEHEAASESSE